MALCLELLKLTSNTKPESQLFRIFKTPGIFKEYKYTYNLTSPLYFTINRKKTIKELLQFFRFCCKVKKIQPYPICVAKFTGYLNCAHLHIWIFLKFKISYMYYSYNTSTTFLLFMPPLSIKLKFCFSTVKINTHSKFLYHATQPVKFWMTVKGILDRTGFF